MVDGQPRDIAWRRRLHERRAAGTARLTAAQERIARSNERVQQLRELLAAWPASRPEPTALDGGDADPDRALAELQDDLSWALEQLEIRTQEVRSLQDSLAESERELAATMRELRVLNEELQELSSRAADRPVLSHRSRPPRPLRRS
ncbi:hypothetical protein ACI782_12010 [Geodermatophilus sp. SYSU D00703]